MKHRGFVEKQEVEHSGDGLKIIIEKADDVRDKKHGDEKRSD